MERRHWGQHDASCGPCRWQSVGIAPSAMPSRRNTVAPTNPVHNSWEKGVATDPATGMAYLDSDFKPIPLHDWQSKRSRYLSELNAQTTAPTATAG